MIHTKCVAKLLYFHVTVFAKSRCLVMYIHMANWPVIQFGQVWEMFLHV